MDLYPIVVKTVDSPVGPLLLGATERGVCLCEFADRGGRARIEKRLFERHKRTAVDGDSPHIATLERQLAEYFAGTRRDFDLPLDLAGSPWQRKVWDGLLSIPFGETRGYGELAEALGKPGGARAVGRANGENYVAIVVPCHRVIEAGGGLRGYGGGLERKRWLLEHESGEQRLGL
jgi:AraC family transcriptional regulator of adaptative response/methylated-DNA-[protein]-cysteine methyltransferase